MEGDSQPMATAKPSRTRLQLSSKPMTPAQVQRRREQVAQERTKEMAAAAYQRVYRKTEVLMAQQQAKADAMRNAGVKQQQQGTPAQPKQKTRAKAGRRLLLNNKSAFVAAEHQKIE